MIRPTLSQLLGMVRRMFLRLVSVFDLTDHTASRVDLSSCLVSVPPEGILVRVCPEFYVKTSACSRRACDFARPM